MITWGSLPGAASANNPFADADCWRDVPCSFIAVPNSASTFDEFQLVVSQLDDLGLGVEFRHGVEVS